VDRLGGILAKSITERKDNNGEKSEGERVAFFGGHI
jgi:hypothetical protein